MLRFAARYFTSPVHAKHGSAMTGEVDANAQHERQVRGERPESPLHAKAKGISRDRAAWNAAS